MTQPRSAVSMVVMAIGVLVWWWLLAPPPLGGGTSYILVHGISMEPTYYAGDLVVVRQRSAYAAGDVVAFRAQGMGIVGPNGVGIVIHRIIGGDAQNGFLMLGDNNPEPDAPKPTAEHIVGSAVLHVPRIGRLMELAQHRHVLAAGITLVSVWPILFVAGLRRRRKGGRIVTLPASSTGGTASSGALPSAGALSEAPRPVALTFFVATGIAALAALVGFIAFRQPLTESKMTPRLQYTQSGAFDYGIEVAPATIYPSGIVRPQPGVEAKDAAKPEQAVFTRLANAIDVEYRYRLEGNGGAEVRDVRGTVRTDLEIRAAEGWTRTTPLTTPRPFEGTEVVETARVDLRAIGALLDRVEAETGFEAKSYELLITPVVDLEGTVGTEAVTESFPASLLVKFDPQRVAPQGTLEVSKPTNRSELVKTATNVGVGPVQASTAYVRVGTAALTAGAGTIALLLAGVIFLGIGRGDEAKIRARYGSMLLRVVAAEDDAVRDRVRVVSIRDLARIAERAGVLILEERHESLGLRYFVRDGDTVYEFVPDPPTRRGRFTDFVARARPDIEPAGNEA